MRYFSITLLILFGCISIRPMSAEPVWVHGDLPSYQQEQVLIYSTGASQGGTVEWMPIPPRSFQKTERYDSPKNAPAPKKVQAPEVAQAPKKIVQPVIEYPRWSPKDTGFLSEEDLYNSMGKKLVLYCHPDGRAYRVRIMATPYVTMFGKKDRYVWFPVAPDFQWGEREVGYGCKFKDVPKTYPHSEDGLLLTRGAPLR